MPGKALKYVVRKNKESVELLKLIAKALGLEFAISFQEKSMLGQITENLKFQSAIDIHGEQIGVLHTSKPNNALLLYTLQHLINRELEKKKIVSEVLNLYREINMIYDFTEQLSEKLDIAEIGKITLSEACHITDSDAGLFLRFNPEKFQLDVLNEQGLAFSDQLGLKEYQPLLIRLMSKGNCAIADKSWLLENNQLNFLNSLMYAPLRSKHHDIGLMLLGRKNSTREYRASDLKLLTTIALQATTAIETAYLFERNINEALQREEAIRKIHEFTNRFVPHEFINSLGKSNLTQVQLGDLVEREVTVLFADIRDFTSLSETMTPEENFKFINAFNLRMGPIIRQHFGFINQYLGDGFMAIFPEGPKDALEASVQMQLALQKYNAYRIEKGRKTIKLGIGMQTGPLIMGITGDHVRMDAATISDTVNTASRIESLSKHYGANILLTEDSINNIPNQDNYQFRFLGQVLVKGKASPLKIYECIDGDSQDLFLHKIETKSAFDLGMRQYINKEFAMAAVSFQSVTKAHREDKTAMLMLKKAARLITEEVSEDWKGIETLQYK